MKNWIGDIIGVVCLFAGFYCFFVFVVTVWG